MLPESYCYISAAAFTDRALYEPNLVVSKSFWYTLGFITIDYFNNLMKRKST